MRAVYWLIRKDILRFMADRNGAVLTLLTPVILGALMGSLLGGSDESPELKVLVVDLDKSQRSGELVKAMDGDETLVVEVVTEAVAMQRIEEGDASVALVLPEGAGEALTPFAMFGGTQLDARLLYDPSRKIEADLCAGLMTKIMMEQVGKRFGDPQSMGQMFRGIRAREAANPNSDAYTTRWLAFLDEGISLTDAQATPQEPSAPSRGMRPPLNVNKEAVIAAGSGSGYNSYAHNFAGSLCLFLLFWALDAAKELVNEKEQGTLLRLRSAPLSVGQLLAARALSAAVVAVLMACCVYGSAMLFFDVKVLGTLVGFGVMLFSIAFFIGAFTVLLVGITRSERQLANVGVIAVLLMSFVGGAMIPSFVMPDWVQSVAMVLPTHWATEGLAAATWRGLGLEHAMVPAGVLAGISALCLVIGVRAYRWE